MSKGRELMMDGLDALREQMDHLHEDNPGWVLRALGAPEPHPASAVLVEAGSRDVGKVISVVLLEEHVIDKAQRTEIMSKFSKAIRQLSDDHRG